MAHESTTSVSALHFLVTNGPGPFQLIAGQVDMYRNRLEPLILEFELLPIEVGEKLLGHDRKFKIQFEVALLGSTQKMGHGVEEPRNIRLLGRFLVPGYFEDDLGAGIDVLRVADALTAWQWEIVFRTQGQRHGMVSRLDQPLPKDWTL